MVLGNHARQRGYRPDDLTDWFATAFVDGFRWAVPTNVVGMSQHADGGLLATKPYGGRWSRRRIANASERYTVSRRYNPRRPTITMITRSA
jgi:deoxyribodipyrimidine photolyase-like uncharacterized protein